MINYKSRIGIICLTFFIISILISCSSESKTLKVTPAKLDFENINLGDTLTIDVILKNKYGKSILITSVSIIGSNDFIITAGNTIPISLDKNAEHVVSIMFAPSAAGAFNAFLSITHDASTKPKVMDIKGVGVAVARIKLSDTTFDFGTKIINRAHTHDLDIENVGTSDLEISNLSFVGAGAALYSISAGGPTPINILPGTIKTITIAFNPIIMGSYKADLQIHHNAVNDNSPIIYPVSGDGVDVDPQITLNQTSPWDFGTVATTLPSTQICEIENTGIDPLTVTSASLATGTAYSVDSLKDSNGNVINFPQVVAVGAKIMLAIKFAPTSNTTFNDTLTFIHDGTNEVTPWDISLTGEGRVIVTKTFSYTGASEQWTVPAGVVSITVTALGAQGGTVGSATGGKGGQAKATIPVTPSESLNIYVGGEGTRTLSTTTGGFNGGGGVDAYGSGYAGTGGGASDVRRGTDLSDRLIVAAAGGGGGWESNALKGGYGGGLTGQDAPDHNPYWAEAHGKGGTQTAGGAAGYYTNNAALPGVFGVGGRGKGDNAGGGGGGGGWYGGGGGIFTGGGGGSSYYDASGNTNKSTTPDVQTGNGKITIDY